MSGLPTTLYRRARAVARTVFVDERGISLVVAVMVLSVLTVAGGSVAVYTTSNVRSATSDQSESSAYQVAQAGLGEALAKLQGAADPTVTTIFGSPTTVSYPALGGSATYTGTAVVTNDPDIVTWTLKSTGTVNQGQQRQVTLQQSASVRPLQDGGNLGSWSRFYADNPSKCITIDTVSMPASIATQGCLKLVNGGSITGSSTEIEVGTTVTITGPTTDTGWKSPSTGSGSSWTNPTKINSSDNVYATYSLSSGSTTNQLTATNFGFAIPTTAVVQGVTASIERKATNSGDVKDYSVKLVKAGSATGSSEADTSTYFGSSDSTNTGYGGSSDLWGTTLTAADVNASNFGLAMQFKNYDSRNSDTVSVDQVRLTVYYTDNTNGIGSSSTPISKATIGDKCQYNAQTAEKPCSSTDHVYAGSIVTQTPDDLTMPTIDWDYWYNNAAPGPKHPCTNSNPNMGNLKFDDNGKGPDGHMVFDNDPSRDMTPLTTDYTCQVVQNGVLIGDLEWNHTTHVLKIGGTIFFDGNVRFDDDGQLVHYQGRGIIMAYGNIEFDELVCAGGTGTSQTCATNMSSWDPTKNYMVLYGHQDSEYDQGGSSCYNMPAGEVCAANGKHPQSGFQGTLSADAQCEIHEEFFLSGPVICDSISLPYESDGWPTYYPFPSLSNLVDGQKYGDFENASAWEITPGPVTGG